MAKAEAVSAEVISPVPASVTAAARAVPAVELDGAQKAAAVVVALGAEKASLLYQYMDPDDVEQVTVEVAKLGFLDADTTEAVLGEFYQMCMMNKAVTEGGGRFWKKPSARKTPTRCWIRSRNP